MAIPIYVGDKFVTDIGQLSYPYLIQKQLPMTGSESDERYKAQLIFAPNKPHPNILRAWNDVLEETGWRNADLPYPCFRKIKKSESEKYGYPVDGMLLRTWNLRKPVLFSNTSADSDSRLPEQLDFDNESVGEYRKLFYQGVYVRFNINFFAWRRNKKAGISAHLHGVQFQRHCSEEEIFQSVTTTMGFTT